MSKERLFQTSSIPEKTVLYYIRQYFRDVQNNIRLEEMDFLELDIYVPSLKLAIEYDGGFWHSSVIRDIEKDNLCQRNGITLIRIREFTLPIYPTSAILIKTERPDVRLHYMVPVLEELFKDINKLFSLKIIPNINVDDDYTQILDLIEKLNYEQSLAVKEPELAKEWDYSKNKSLKPENVACGSSKRVWWLCDKGHSYKAALYQRKKSGCPYCAGKRVLQGFNDLKTLEPEVSKEWDYSKNDGLVPEDFTVGASKRVWWRCEKGHSWRAAISNRTNKDNRNKCPYCSGKKPIVGINDLATVSPNLVKEWDFKKNDNLKPTDVMISSGKVVWWLCNKGHSFKTAVYVRQKSGCPYCGNKAVLKGYNDLETLAPNIAKEWHPTLNNDLTPSNVVAGSNKKVWWKCSICGYEWRTQINNRFYSHTGCPACAHQVVRKRVQGVSEYDSIGRPMYNDLATVRPDLVNEWDYERNNGLRPEDVNAGADKKVWWICDKGHHYLATIYQRATREHQTNCPYCSNKKVLKGYNDLATLNPEVAAEWNYEKNGDLKPSDFVVSSGKKVWWKCKTCGHEWEAIICNRSSKHNQTKCPVCTHQVLVPGVNDLATVYPQLMEEWDFKKNTLNPHEISGGTNKKAWWICKECGHSWQTSIPVRTKMNGGCPKCRHKQGGSVKSEKAAYPIIQLDLKGNYIREWSSIKEAKTTLNISGSTISAVIKGKAKSAGGFKWAKK